jgi:hypothetical protein
MAEQDDATQGAVPPKISPIAKPEGPAAATPAGAPRPITVRLKPVTAPTPSAAPAAAPAVTPAAPAPVSAAAAAPRSPNPKATTTRVPVPEGLVSTPSAIRPATVRLRPVAPPSGSAAPTYTPGATQAISQVELSATAPIAPVPSQPQHAPAIPVSKPVDQPTSAAQVQAAKSKTSRISLDSAIGVTPAAADKDGPKTIRLKRPSDLTAPAAVSPVAKTPAVSAAAPVAPASARKTSRIPDSALPAAVEDSASVTQKKTLKIKRPGGGSEAAAEGAAASGGDGFPEGVQLTPLTSLDFPAKRESPLLTTVAVVCASAAAVVLLLLTLCLGAHAVGPDAGRNSVASISLGQTTIPWPGHVAD